MDIKDENKTQAEKGLFILASLITDGRCIEAGIQEDNEPELIEKAWRNICKLFEPKPDESRLLTNKEVENLADKFVEKNSANQLRLDRGDWKIIIPTMLKAQHVKDMKWEAKPVSIKDAECQARVQRIFKEIEEQNPVDEILGGVILTPNQWQALKKQEHIE